jgi:hypothetical protein
MKDNYVKCELCGLRYKSNYGILCPSCKDIEIEKPLDDIVDLRHSNDNQPIIHGNWWIE